MNANRTSNESHPEGTTANEPAKVMVGSDPSTLDTAAGDAPVMSLREWNVTHAYASYYVEPLSDLHAAAEALVRTGVATCAYIADGEAYWLAKGKLEKQRPALNWREHENHARLKLPDGIEGWAKQGLFRALLHRFSEKRVMSPLPGPQHEYLRAAMEPASLVFGDEQVIVCPTLKLYKTGIFTISYDVIAQAKAVGIPELITRYVNLFARWCNEAWVPHTIAKLGAATSLHGESKDREARKANLGMFMLMQAAVEQSARMIEVDDLEFQMYPAHAPLDDFLMSVLVEAARAPTLRGNLPPKVRDLVGLASTPVSNLIQPQPTIDDVEHAGAVSRVDQTKPGAAAVNCEPTIDSTSAAMDRNSSALAEAGKESPTHTADAELSKGSEEHGEEQTSALSYQLSDMFDNAEFAVRVALDPPPDGKTYVRRGLSPRLTRGDYWHNRPQVSINVFKDQPTSASEIRDRFGDQLGLVMLRVPSAPKSVARTQLDESLRPFEDYSLHISQALSLCVYASERCYQVHPPILEMMDRACLFEMVDYLSMRCHQLDERASLASSVAEARAVRADLGVTENLARTAFRAGELNAATMAAWQQLELPATLKEAREKVSLAAEAASERSNEQGARFNAALAVVFGIVGAAGLTDSFTKPLWVRLGFPLPEGLEGPVCFVISAGFVGVILWLVTHLLKRS